MAQNCENPYKAFSILSPHRYPAKQVRLFLIVWAFIAGLGSGWADDRAEPEPWPQNTPDYFEAKELLAKRKWDQAAIVLQRVFKKNPDYPMVAMELAKALIYSGRREEALGVLGQAQAREKGERRELIIRKIRVLSRLFLKTETSQFYSDGMHLLDEKKYRASRELFEKALELEPDNAEVLTRIGQCYELDNDHDSASERLKLAKKLNPYEPEIKLWVGRALFQRGEVAEALNELKVADKELDASELAPLWLADALIATGQKPAAVSLLEKDAKSQPFHLQTLVILAKLKTQQAGKDSQTLWSARRDLQLALSRLPKYTSPEVLRFETELGVDQRKSADGFKAEIESMLRVIDDRLEVVKATTKS